MKRILYHGSSSIVDKPKFGKGAMHNDYGRGFYCTEEMELAKEWACAKNMDGYANAYEFDMTGLKVLYLIDTRYSILHWLAILARYRTYWERGSISETAKKYLQEHYLIDLTEYDCIIGYRADDSYFSFVQDFVSGGISLKQLSDAMYLGKLGEQVVLKSAKAFEQLQYIGHEVALCEEYYMKKVMRDKRARSEYRKTKTVEPNIHDVYMIDIMRNGGE
ncbi:MAG: DUF3990 domain-containing protein [Eubacteriales bacterium]